MTVPPPEYDLALLREHAFHDTNIRQLVIPPAAMEKGFKPIHEKGLGLFEYEYTTLLKESPEQAAFWLTTVGFFLAVITLLAVFKVNKKPTRIQESVFMTPTPQSVVTFPFGLPDLESGRCSDDDSANNSPRSPLLQSPLFLKEELDNIKQPTFAEERWREKLH